jgi:NADH:ubiquinone oxidoreductase subunit E
MKETAKGHEGCPCETTDEDLINRLDEIIVSYAHTEGALIPVLQTAQNLFGYLPESVLKRISEKMNVPYSEVTGVVSFYSYFSTVPRGKNVVRVCLGTACYVRGGKEVLESFRKHLGINVGGTTADRNFSLAVGRCFGACGLAPAVMINDDVHQRVKPAKIKELLSSYESKEIKTVA